MHDDAPRAWRACAPLVLALCHTAADSSPPISSSPSAPVNASELASARAYLAEVYPSAQLDGVADAQIVEFLATREYFYTLPSLPRGLIGTLSCFRAQLTQQRRPSRRTCSGVQAMVRRPEPNRFPSIRACTTEAACIGAINGWVPRGWIHAAEPVFRTRDAHLEVVHTNSANAPQRQYDTRDSRVFFEPGPEPLRLAVAPGSGVWYRAERALCAPTKTAVLAELLREALARTPPPPWRAQLDALVSALRLGANTSAALALVRHAARGDMGALRSAPLSTAFVASGLSRLHLLVGLGDRHDGLLGWLGRALGYTALLLSASPSGRTLTPPTLAPEVVHIALPRTPAFGGVDEPSTVLRWAARSRPPWAWTREQAAELIAALRASRALSLRDPFERIDEGRALECAFWELPPRAMLGCPLLSRLPAHAARPPGANESGAPPRGARYVCGHPSYPCAARG